jgi:hypothetical protein
MAICSPSDFWANCAQKTKAAIQAATTPQQAFDAAADWQIRYRKLYDASPSGDWTPSDQARIEQFMEDLFDENLGVYLDPAALALVLALKRYAPTLAAILDLGSTAAGAALYILLAPSPIANDFTQAKPINEEINQLLSAKLDELFPYNWRSSYDVQIRNAFQKARGTPIP